jgi:hypothetical protein
MEEINKLNLEPRNKEKMKQWRVKRVKENVNK